MRKIVKGLEEVKMKIADLKGKSIEMSINRGRKRIENLSATIKDVYPSVFTVKTLDEKVQTFSYFDVMCGNVVIDSE